MTNRRTRDRLCTSAPLSSSTCTTAGCRWATAHISAVWSSSDSVAFTSAPWSNSAATASALPVLGTAHQDGLTSSNGGLRISTRSQQEAHHRRVAIGAGERQRHNAVRVGDPGVRARLQQQARRLDIVEISCPVQRRRAVRLRRTHGDGGIQQPAYRRVVLQLDGVDEALVRILRTHWAQAQQQENSDNCREHAEAPQSLPDTA